MLNLTLTSLIFTLIFSISCATLAQSTNWTYIAGQQSGSNTLSTLSDGNYIITNKSTATPSSNNFAKIESNGDLIWERNLDVNTSEAVIFATDLPNADLLLITKDGKIYRTDASGNSPVLAGQFTSSSTARISGLHYDVTHLDIVYFIGTVEDDNDRFTLRASIDLESLAITTNLGEDEGYPNGIAFSNTGLRAELRSNLQDAGVYFYDENLEVTSSIDLTQSGNAFFSDLTFDDAGNIYVTGTETSNNNASIRNGLIALIDTNQNLSWLKRLPRPMGYESLGLKHILAKAGRLFIGGRSGPTSERIEGFAGEIDAQGNLLWETPFDVSNNNEEVISLEYVSGANVDELIAFGTSGLTDFVGPQRTFMTSINIMTSSTHNEQLSDAQIFYPNPVVDILHLELAPTVTKIEVRNMNGVLVDVINGEAETVDMTGYAAGVYFFKTLSGDLAKSTKVIKQ